MEAHPAEPPGPTSRVSYPQIDIDLIEPNRSQPRQGFDEEGLESLAKSLKQEGFLQPVVVRPLPDGRFELIAGERRWRAAQRAGLLKIPVLVKEVAEDRLLELALVENLQREELNPIEEARAYQTLIEDLGLTQQEVAERIGRQRTTVANSLRILGLPEPVQQLVRSAQISMGHARALAGLERSADQITLATRIVKEGLSVRAVEASVSALQGRARGGARETRAGGRDPNVIAAEEALQKAMRTKVRIVQSAARGRGRVELHFFSADELDRLYEVLMHGARRTARRPAQTELSADA